MTPCALIDEKQ